MMTAALSGARGGVCAFSPLNIPHFGATDKGYVRSQVFSRDCLGANLTELPSWVKGVRAIILLPAPISRE